MATDRTTVVVDCDGYEGGDEPELGICGDCCCPVPQGSEPVQGSGWYSGHLYRWQSSPHLARLVRVRCDDCGHDED